MRIFCLTSFLCLILMPSVAFSQGHGNYCDQADSTASTVKCLKDHLTDAQERLNLVYKNLEQDMNGEQRSELKELQNTWLVYRDSECMWEAQRSDVVTLKNINELSCMARVTDDRADLLSVTLTGVNNPSGQREFGSFPRWMNVVSKENKDVFWNYGDRQRLELNCDTQDEYVMWGIKTDSNVDKAHSIYKKTLIIAIADNPPIGRPEITKFSFLISDVKGPENICNDQISVATLEEAHPDVQNIKTCTKQLKVSAIGCADKTISWSGKEFTLDNTRVTDMKTAGKK